MSREERDFIHSIANLVTIAQGKARSAKRKLTGSTGCDKQSEIEADLAKIDDALNRLIVLMKDRRSVLIDREQEAS